MGESGKERKERGGLPPLGLRIIKTSIAVFLCLLIGWLRGLGGQDMSAEAAITAIVCMQPYVRDSGEYALNRFSGTLIGSAWGLLFLLIVQAQPALGTNRLALYLLMAVGVMLSLYSSVAIRQTEASGLAAIVFICIVIAFPDIEDPLLQALNRFLDVLIGTGVAIAVNVFRLPRRKNPNLVIFLHEKDLVPDRFSQVGSAVMFRLNYLYNDGARISLITEHAPAFFVMQMSMVKVNTPLIVMDGAAIFDLNEDCYLYMKTIPTDVSADLRTTLDRLGIGYFIYTVHRNKTCIFHHGEFSAGERMVYDRMRRSPYRSYLEGEIYDPREVINYKIIDTKENLARILIELAEEGGPDAKRLRPVIRPQSREPGLYGLYLYNDRTSVESAKEILMEMLQQETPELTAREIKLKKNFRSDRDAIHLLHQAERLYAPVKWPFP